MKLNETGNKILIRTLLPVLMVLLPSAGLVAGEVSLYGELEQTEIWLGDSVRLTLYLQGSEEAISPPLEIPGIKVEALGGSTRSSRSVSNINGKVTETVRKAYVYGYSLKPGTAGSYVIPPVTAVVGGKTLTTSELFLTVKQPGLSDDFKLNLQFDKNRIYTDEECSLKISFLYSENLRGLKIGIPAIAGFDYTGVPFGRSGDRYEIEINGESVVFSRDDQAGMAGLSAVLVLRPDTAASIRLDESTASFESVTGYQRVQDFFGRITNQEVYGRNVVSGTPARIEVLPFPENGRPDDFFGLSGDVSMTMSAEPLNVHIGDPITLTLTVSGLNNPDVVIPSLADYLPDGIDIPDSRAAAGVSGGTRTVRQTVRIKDPDTNRIPSISFSYFDPVNETYSRAETGPLELKVLDTRIVTAEQLEGVDSTENTPGKVLLEKTRGGIHHNYSGKKLLESQQPGIELLRGSAAVKLLLVLPPVIFIMILIFTTVLPQLRAAASVRADRKSGLRKLKNLNRKADLTVPDAFLRDLNGRLSEFLAQYGTDSDRAAVADKIELIHSVIYGGRATTPEEAADTASAVVGILENGERRDEE